MDDTDRDGRSSNSNRTMPAWLVGWFAGDVFWGLTLTGVYFFEAVSRWLGPTGDLFDTMGNICALIAAPVTIGGWLFIWGDNGPPYSWLGSWTFNISFGLILYGGLGALTATIASKCFIRS